MASAIPAHAMQRISYTPDPPNAESLNWPGDESEGEVVATNLEQRCLRLQEQRDAFRSALWGLRQENAAQKSRIEALEMEKAELREDLEVQRRRVERLTKKLSSSSISQPTETPGAGTSRISETNGHKSSGKAKDQPKTSGSKPIIRKASSKGFIPTIRIPAQIRRTSFVTHAIKPKVSEHSKARLNFVGFSKAKEIKRKKKPAEPGQHFVTTDKVGPPKRAPGRSKIETPQHSPRVNATASTSTSSSRPDSANGKKRAIDMEDSASHGPSKKPKRDHGRQQSSSTRSTMRDFVSLPSSAKSSTRERFDRMISLSVTSPSRQRDASNGAGASRPLEPRPFIDLGAYMPPLEMIEKQLDERLARTSSLRSQEANPTTTSPSFTSTSGLFDSSSALRIDTRIPSPPLFRPPPPPSPPPLATPGENSPSVHPRPASIDFHHYTPHTSASSDLRSELKPEVENHSTLAQPFPSIRYQYYEPPATNHDSNSAYKHPARAESHCEHERERQNPSQSPVHAGPSQPRPNPQPSSPSLLPANGEPNPGPHAYPTLPVGGLLISTSMETSMSTPIDQLQLEYPPDDDDMDPPRGQDGVQWSVLTEPQLPTPTSEPPAQHQERPDDRPHSSLNTDLLLPTSLPPLPMRVTLGLHIPIPSPRPPMPMVPDMPTSSSTTAMPKSRQPKPPRLLIPPSPPRALSPALEPETNPYRPQSPRQSRSLSGTSSLQSPRYVPSSPLLLEHPRSSGPPLLPSPIWDAPPSTSHLAPTIAELNQIDEADDRLEEVPVEVDPSGMDLEEDQEQEEEEQERIVKREVSVEEQRLEEIRADLEPMKPEEHDDRMEEDAEELQEDEDEEVDQLEEDVMDEDPAVSAFDAPEALEEAPAVPRPAREDQLDAMGDANHVYPADQPQQGERDETMDEDAASPSQSPEPPAEKAQDSQQIVDALLETTASAAVPEADEPKAEPTPPPPPAVETEDRSSPPLIEEEPVPEPMSTRSSTRNRHSPSKAVSTKAKTRARSSTSPAKATAPSGRASTATPASGRSSSGAPNATSISAGGKRRSSASASTSASAVTRSKRPARTTTHWDPLTGRRVLPDGQPASVMAKLRSQQHVKRTRSGLARN